MVECLNRVMAPVFGSAHKVATALWSETKRKKENLLLKWNCATIMTTTTTMRTMMIKLDKFTLSTLSLSSWTFAHIFFSLVDQLSSFSWAYKVSPIKQYSRVWWLPLKKMQTLFLTVCGWMNKFSHILWENYVSGLNWFFGAERALLQFQTKS